MIVLQLSRIRLSFLWKRTSLIAKCSLCFVTIFMVPMCITMKCDEVVDSTLRCVKLFLRWKG